MKTEVETNKTEINAQVLAQKLEQTVRCQLAT